MTRQAPLVDGPRKRALQLQASARELLRADAGAAEAFRGLVPKLRGLHTTDESKLKAVHKDMARLLDGMPSSLRRLVARVGPGEGLARVVIQHLPLFRLDETDRMECACLCALEDPERTLPHLAGLALPPEALVEILLVAASLQPALDFEEYKKIEVLHLAGDSDEPGAKDTQRRFDQARGKLSQHVRRHQLTLLPADLKADAAVLGPALEGLLDQDPFGTLEALRADPDPGLLARLPVARRMDLLLHLASHGLGYASNHLDLFQLPEDAALHPALERIFQLDLIAGSSIFGVYALEGVHHYPFGLAHLEPLLPRRMSSSDAIAYLRKRTPDADPAKGFREAEIQSTLTMLQDKEVQTFLETLKGEIGLQWKARFAEAKRETVFGDFDLKIRNILFLLAHATFQDNARFEHLLETLRETIPAAAEPSILYRLANRHYFLETIGLNPGLLFLRPSKESPQPALIETAGDYAIRTFLHVGMSLHLRIGDALFRAAPIAWNLLINQYEKLDTALQALAFMLEGFDTLFTISESLVADLACWTPALIEALSEGQPQVPAPEASGSQESTLRLVTRGTVDRCRDTLNQYCIQMIRTRAARDGNTPTVIIQGLRLPRSRTDRLFALLEEERKKAMV